MNRTEHIVKALMERHGLSQHEIERQTGVSQPKLSRWANGKSPDAADDALKLASLLSSLDRKASRRKPAQPTAEQPAG